jgi:hypothetical protein
MTLPTWVKEYFRITFPSCFTYEAPQHLMESMCMMQKLKGDLPSWLKTMRNLRALLYSQANARFEAFPALQVFVMCFDRTTPEPKSMVCHTTRYERRCKLCKQKPAVPYGKTVGSEHFDPACERNCIGNQILWFGEGDHLNLEDLDAPLPDWNRFSSDNRNLRQILYPIMMNWMLDYIPPAGKTVLISGLPCNRRMIAERQMDYNSTGANQVRGNVTTREILTPWLLGNLPLPADTDTSAVVMIRGIPPCPQYPTGHLLQQVVPEMRNDIHEADNAIFFFSKFFPDLPIHVACINDGDGISIGLLRAYEDFRGGQQPLQEQWLALPVRGQQVQEDRIEYVNLTLMVQKIESHPNFIAKGIQSPIATIVFMVILAGTDFFDGEFCFGIGHRTDWKDDDAKRSKQTKGIWDTFLDRLDMFHHMVQYYVNVRNYSGEEERRIVLDEDLFAIFTKMCYTNKYEVSAKGKPIEVHCAKFKDPRKHFPNDQLIQRWARQIGWNLNYWANAWRGIYIDPFERYLGESYWGYTKDSGIVNVVASKQKPLDEVHKRHMWKRTQKQLQVVNIPEARKKNAMDAVRGIY